MTETIERQLSILEAKLQAYELLLLSLVPVLAQNEAIRRVLEEQLSVFSVATRAMETQGDMSADDMREYEPMEHLKRLLTLISAEMHDPLELRASLASVPKGTKP